MSNYEFMDLDFKICQDVCDNMKVEMANVSCKLVFDKHHRDYDICIRGNVFPKKGYTVPEDKCLCINVDIYDKGGALICVLYNYRDMNIEYSGRGSFEVERSGVERYFELEKMGAIKVYPRFRKDYE